MVGCDLTLKAGCKHCEQSAWPQHCREWHYDLAGVVRGGMQGLGGAQCFFWITRLRGVDKYEGGSDAFPLLGRKPAVVQVHRVSHQDEGSKYIWPVFLRERLLFVDRLVLLLNFCLKIKNKRWKAHKLVTNNTMMCRTHTGDTRPHTVCLMQWCRIVCEQRMKQEESSGCI